jgi:Putative beta-barrel porin-2, OmpL-like. bbp2
MPFTVKCGLARVTCFVVCIAWATGFIVAQEIDSANEPGGDGGVILTRPNTDEGAPYNVLHAMQEAQTQGPATANTLDPESQENVFKRLGKFYAADWTGKLRGSPTPERRALDAPLESPPFPSSDWGYGGSPPIGVPDGNVYPLMTALKMENRRTKVYGWVAGSVNASTSSKNNFPVSYDIFPNRVEMNQAVVYIERLPNTVQKTHFDWGFHVTGFYGIDYRFTTAKGYFSQQLLQKNHVYGFDPVLEYVDLYFPVKQGLNIRIGRFLSVPGIEAQLAPNNYNMNHSLLYTIDPFTETGAIATLKLSKQWIVQAGISAGHDVAPWTTDRQPSAIVCVDYSTASNHDNFYACANGINDGKYAYNNLQDYDGTWYHRFNAKWHMATEAWYMYEREVPNVAGNVANPAPTETGANGAFCAPGELRCTAPEYAFVNYLNRQLSPKLFVGFRSDMLNDKKGQRTGIPGRYTENTLYATKYIGSTILLRPELRFDHSWDARGYDAGKARNQFFFGVDLIYKF